MASVEEQSVTRMNEDDKSCSKSRQPTPFEFLMMIFLSLYSRCVSYTSADEANKQRFTGLVNSLYDLRKWCSSLFDLKSESDKPPSPSKDDIVILQERRNFVNAETTIKSFTLYLVDLLQGRSTHDTEKYKHISGEIIDPSKYSMEIFIIRIQDDCSNKHKLITELIDKLCLRYDNIDNIKSARCSLWEEASQRYKKYALFIVSKGIVNLLRYADYYDLTLLFVTQIIESCKLIKIMYFPDHDDKMCDQEKEKIKASFKQDYNLIIPTLGQTHELREFLNAIFELLFPIYIN
jgi:hypothetical protein